MWKRGRVRRSVLGCEPLFRRMRPDVMRHLLVSGLSQHIWPLFYICGSAAEAVDSRLHCVDGKWGLSVIPLRWAFDCHREPIVSVRKKKKKACLPGSSLASSAVLPSSMSKSTSRTVLRSWFRGTGEREGWRRDAGLDKGLTKVLHFTVIPAHGYCLAVCYFSTRPIQCHGTIELSQDYGGWWLLRPGEKPAETINDEKGRRFTWCNAWAKVATRQLNTHTHLK